MRRMWVAGAAIVACLALVGVPTSAQDESSGQPGGAVVTAVEQLDERMVDLSIDSPSVGEVQVRLLLPPGFDAESDRTWPTLYLLHGAFQSYADWTTQTDVEAFTEGSDLLVVMPEADTGWYSDWWNDGAGGAPMWETFHLTELPRLLEQDWQAGEARAVAGFSMGGFGAMSYAARHPGSFKAAASFMGALDPLLYPDDIVNDVVDPGVWGERGLQRQNWEAHDPTVLAGALDGITLYVSYGNGEYGPLDEVEDELGAWIEANVVLPQNEAFVGRLEETGIPATVDAYGPGTHSWPYAERGLHDALPLLIEAVQE